MAFGIVSMLIFAFRIPGAYKAAANYRNHTTGQVTLIREVTDSGNTTLGNHWDVYVAFEVDGQRYVGFTTEGKYSSPEVGDSYTVWYDADDPDMNYVNEDPFLYFKQCTGIAAACLVVSAAAFIAWKKCGGVLSDPEEKTA